MARNAYPPRKNGFTLIELLVVIVIIALTAAILVPVSLEVRRNSYGATCQSNLKQIGLAIAMYQQDNDSYFVPKYNCSIFDPLYPDHCIRPKRGVNAMMENGVLEWIPPPEATPDTDYLLKPYIKNTDIFKCPARFQGDASDPSSGGRYTINAWDSLFGLGRPETGPQGQPESLVEEPSNTMIVMEHTNHAGECQSGQQGGDADQDTIGVIPGHWEIGHSEGFNSLWCDGHVRRLRPEQLRRSMFRIQKNGFAGGSGSELHSN